MQDRESEFVSAFDASLEGFVHRTLKELDSDPSERMI